MDYNIILDLATDLGYELTISGAETFRVEDSISRVIASYGLASEVYAVPNHLIVSIITEAGKPITRMRRIGFHGNDLEAVEKYNALSRAICNRHPEPTEAMDWLGMVRSSIPQYSLFVHLFGNFLGGFGFGILFGCSWLETLLAGICSVLGGYVTRTLGKLEVNPFFSTMASAFCIALLAYGLNVCGIAQNVDGVVIGAFMILVPGLLFVNAMRDVLYGDYHSGLLRVTQVLIVAAAIALGTAVGFTTVSDFWQLPVSVGYTNYPLLITTLASGIGCIGFCIIFNIHGPGGMICALGGMITWAIYILVQRWGGSEIIAYFWSSVFGAMFSEAMARVRKYPAISYLVVSIFPLIPGAGVYYAMNYAVHGEMEAFATQGMHTAAIAGVMAVGILTVSTVVKLYYNIHKRRSGKA